MEEGQRWRDGALAMLRPMTGGVVESSGGREVKRERERGCWGPSNAESRRTRPSRDTNETSKGRKKVKHEGGKVQLSPIGVATHCLEIRDASPDLRASTEAEADLDLDRIFSI